MPKSRPVFVLLSSYNRPIFTIRALSQVSSQLGNCVDNVKITLVDGGSSPLVLNEVSSRFSHINIIELNNSYWSESMVHGWEFLKSSTTELPFFDLLCINDDVDFGLDGLSRFMAWARSEVLPNGIAIGACAEDDLFETVSYGGVLLNNQPQMGSSLFRRAEKLDEHGGYDTMNMNCVLIPSEIIRHYGFLDTFYRHGLSDYDYGLRMSRSGVQLKQSPFFAGVCPRNIPVAYKPGVIGRLKKLAKMLGIKEFPFLQRCYFCKKNFPRSILKCIFGPYIKIFLRA